jgi:hypothetical protein
MAATSNSFANGVLASTGMPLEAKLKSAFARLPRSNILAPGDELSARAKLKSAEKKLGVMEGVNAGKLCDAGWGIVFPESYSDETVDKILRAISALTDRRHAEAGNLYKIFRGKDGHKRNESCIDWLSRHRVAMAPVDPAMGLPFYLLIIGSPAEISFEFQYSLDLYWGTGRIYFDRFEDYERYAQNVVRSEQATAPRNTRTIAIFSPRHEFDDVTKAFCQNVALPLAIGDELHVPLGAEGKFRMHALIGEAATKAALLDLFKAKNELLPPAFIFTGSHGLVLEPSDSRQIEIQGALVCQDWPRFGEIEASHWFSAADFPDDAKIDGLIHLCFACYSCGSPQFEDSISKRSRRPRAIANAPFISRLPQKLLSHGALAVCGHVDRAWTYSFDEGFGVPQIQNFRDLATRVLNGKRIGEATDQFNMRWAVLSTQLADLLQDRENGKRVDGQLLVDLWIARNDARNYIVLGDPAVRLRLDTLLESSAEV